MLIITGLIKVEKRIELDRHDVLFVVAKDGRFLSQPTIKALEIESALVQSHATFKIWKNDGVECEVLQQGGEWASGRAYIRAVIDFVPDEEIPEVESVEIKQLMESPLDDLRDKLDI